MKTLLMAVGLTVAGISHSQIGKKLSAETATRLQPGEVVRYFKTQTNRIENGLPYQVLIVVRPDFAIVKTNKWEFHMKLNKKQQTDLKEDLGYLDDEHLNMYKHEKGTPDDERNRVIVYLAARKGRRTLRWNSKGYDSRGQILLIETLEVYHYFARQEREKN